MKSISVLLADSANNYGPYASALPGYCIDRPPVAPRVPMLVIGQLFDNGHHFGREQCLNHGMTNLVYLVLKYLLVVQKLPATQKMNQCDWKGLLEQQLFDFLVSDAENKLYTEGLLGKVGCSMTSVKPFKLKNRDKSYRDFERFYTKYDSYSYTV